MLKFSANISLLFKELALLQRFEAAKSAGFNAIEIQFPYELPADKIKQKLDQFQLKLVVFNIDADDLLSGGEGLAAVPEKKQQFAQALEQAMVYAELLQPKFINVLPGCCHQFEQLSIYLETFRQNLKRTLTAFQSTETQIVFEAINTYDLPNFIIHNQQQMLDMLKQMNQPKLKLQYDLYHMTRMQQNIPDFLNKNLDLIGHIQFADFPGRAQPGTGTIDFNQFFQSLQNSNYQGWLGAEYIPDTGDTRQTLGWYKP